MSPGPHGPAGGGWAPGGPAPAGPPPVGRDGGSPADPYGRPADPYGRPADPYARPADPFAPSPGSYPGGADPARHGGHGLPPTTAPFAPSGYEAQPAYGPPGYGPPGAPQRRTGLVVAVVVAVVVLVGGLVYAATSIYGALTEGGDYGEDVHLDRLWDACADGDGQACDDLYRQSPLGSEYEEFGDTCGNRYPPQQVWCGDVM